MCMNSLSRKTPLLNLIGDNTKIDSRLYQPFRLSVFYDYGLVAEAVTKPPKHRKFFDLLLFSCA